MSDFVQKSVKLVKTFQGSDSDMNLCNRMLECKYCKYNS